MIDSREEREGEKNSEAPTPLSWADFMKQVATLQATTKGLLFRGHANSRWLIQTTLERRGFPDMPALDYYRMLSRSRYELEARIGRKFDLPPYPELEKKFADYDETSLDLTFGKLPGFEYMTFVRHCGFPTPILDWTRSPYIAAMFAFESPEDKDTPMRSVYAWACPDLTSGGTNEPELKRTGQFAFSHVRHFAQQSDYTICMRFSTDDKTWRFASQMEAPSLKVDEPGKTLFRFDIPSSERKTVTAYLDQFNLNPYSLYGSDESLMQTIAIRELDCLRPPVQYQVADSSKETKKTPE